MAAALSRGVRASIVAALGCTLGMLPHMLVAITGPARSSREVIWQAILVNLLNLRCTASLRQMFVSGFFRALVFSTGCAGDSWRLLSDSESNWPWYTGSPCASRSRLSIDPQGCPFLTIAFVMFSSLRTHAAMAILLGLPAATKAPGTSGIPLTQKERHKGK